VKLSRYSKRYLGLGSVCAVISTSETAPQVYESRFFSAAAGGTFMQLRGKTFVLLASESSYRSKVVFPSCSLNSLSKQVDISRSNSLPETPFYGLCWFFLVVNADAWDAEMSALASAACLFSAALLAFPTGRQRPFRFEVVSHFRVSTQTFAARVAAVCKR
jgi:hypothetical protein